MTMVKEEHPDLARPLDAEDAGEAGAGSASSDEENDVDDEDQEETDTDSDGDNRNVGDAPAMKKGPWTPEEDKRLKEYVEAYGEGNWNRLQRNAGLNRCGKSCRLRWANHLRPDLKKGPFEEDEIDKILEFHMKWGNKWAKMASKLPGRTDNEIKNFWNTRLKRHHKAGMPIYPEYLVSRVTDQNMNCHTPDERHGKKRPNESSHEKVIGMHDLIDEVMTFQHLDYDKDPVVPTKPLKRHASTGNLKNFYSIDLNNVSTSAIASGYPVHGYSGTTMKTELPSFQSLELPLLQNSELPYFQSSELPYFQSSELPSIQNYAPGSDGFILSQTTGLLGASILNGGILEPVKPEIFEVPVPYAHNAVSSNAYCMSQVFDDTEIQASNSSSCMLDASLEACLLTTSLQASLLNTSLQVSLLNDDALHLRNLFNEDDDPLPLENLYQQFDSSASKTDEANHDSTAWKTDGGQSFESSAWKSIASDYHKFDFPSPSSLGSENNE